MYVSQAVLQAAYDDTGLALDFYKSARGNMKSSCFPGCV